MQIARGPEHDALDRVTPIEKGIAERLEEPSGHQDAVEKASASRWTDRSERAAKIPAAVVLPTPGGPVTISTGTSLETGSSPAAGMPQR
jgi:hypothetical protein